MITLAYVTLGMLKLGVYGMIGQLQTIICNFAQAHSVFLEVFFAMSLISQVFDQVVHMKDLIYN